MFVIITILNDIFKTYLESFKKDAGQEGFQMITIIAVSSWVGLLIACVMALLGQFKLPSDPLFYVLWLTLTLLTVISFTLFLSGMMKSTFFVANSFTNASFIITAVYAAFFLGERCNTFQIAAVAVAGIGTLFFFEGGISKKVVKENKGLFLILFSFLFTPFEYIIYKSATLHTHSYNEFLTGRLIVDFIGFNFFFVIVSVFWYRSAPFRRARKLLSSSAGMRFVLGSSLAELLESFLIFKIPISLFTILGTLSIPTAYFVGAKKYHEPYQWRYIIGAVLVAVGIILFVIKSSHLSDF